MKEDIAETEESEIASTSGHSSVIPYCPTDCTTRTSSGRTPEESADEQSKSDKQKSGVSPTLLDQMYSGSSNLMSAIEATNATCIKSKRKRHRQESCADKVEANRRSAKESRNRKKLIQEELQKSVARLAQENGELRIDNEAMRRENNSLKFQLSAALGALQVVGVSGASTTLSLSSAAQQQQQQQLQIFPQQVGKMCVQALHVLVSVYLIFCARMLSPLLSLQFGSLDILHSISYLHVPWYTFS